jgi:hypothetical protein
MFRCLVRRLSLISVLLWTGLLLSSCKIDGEEQIEIHADGAVTMHVNYQFPELGFSLADGNDLVSYLQGFEERHEIISIQELSCERAGNATVRFIAEIHISDPIKLREIMPLELELIEKEELLNPSLLAKLKALFGSSIIEVEGVKIKFHRKIEFEGLIKAEMPHLNPDLLGDFHFRYSITSPSASSKNNASTISNDGKTLTWVMPLKQYLNEPFIMQAKIPIPIPWWVWLLSGLVILMIIFVLWKIFSMVFKRKPKQVVRNQ